MSRLIDADALKKEHRMSEKACAGCPSQEICHGTYDALPQYTIKDICEWLDEAPTIENEPKKGEWIDRIKYEDNIECPFCHVIWNVLDNCTETFNFCPNCGANMKGDSK